MKSVNVIVGVLAGVAAGAIAGVLFAPDKGTVTRNNISRKSDEYAQKYGGHIKTFIEGVTNKFESITHQASQLAENGADKLHQASDMQDGHRKI